MLFLKLFKIKIEAMMNKESKAENVMYILITFSDRKY